jgi:hypothetical protein
VSLESARAKGVNYATWLSTRLNRLVSPLLMLIIAWAGIGIVMGLMGVTPNVIQFSSQAALIPTWFLAIYIMVVILAPTSYRFWKRFGFASFWVFAAAGAVVDALFFLADIRWLGWSNYFWVWMAVHHLGFAWRDGRFRSPVKLLFYSALGLAALSLLILKGPYPLAMVGSPDEGLSNTLPPKITLLALGVFQFGLLLSLEGPMRRVLESLRIWAATVLINTMIMTVYLWHITVMIVFIAILYLVGGVGLGIEPGTPDWWYSRPIWIAVLIVLLVPVALLMSPLERRPRSADDGIPGPARQIVGATILCLGIALLAMYGYGGGPVRHLDAMSFAMVIAGSVISGVLPGIRRRPRSQ